MQAKCKFYLTELLKSSYVPGSRTCFKKMFSVSALLKAELKLLGGGAVCVSSEGKSDKSWNRSSLPSQHSIWLGVGPALAGHPNHLCASTGKTDCCSMWAAIPFPVPSLVNDQLVKQIQFLDYSVFCKTRCHLFTSGGLSLGADGVQKWLYWECDWGRISLPI